MIRINLYPTKPVKKKEKAGIIDLVVFLLVTLVCAAAIWFINGMISEKIERQTLANDTKQTKIASIKQSIQDHDQIKAQLAEIEAREKIIQELIAARTGPVSS
jgi:Tfp pilus assembly protein PilN